MMTICESHSCLFLILTFYSGNSVGKIDLSEEVLSNCEKAINADSSDVITDDNENDLSGQQQQKKKKTFSNKTVRGRGVSLFPMRR